MENKKTALSGKALRKTGLLAALLLTAMSLSACIIAPDRGGRFDHHWGGGAGWQGNGGGWNHYH